MRLLSCSLLALWVAGCDCDPCPGVPLEVVDAMTGDPIPNAEARMATHAHGRRHRVEDGRLADGAYRLWVRAPGYRTVTEKVEIAVRCVDFEGFCPDRDAYTVALERR
ncbi:MAG: hypothetical protein ACE37F_15550 [Nannocystaceae bacterium]|nr:hypothetical protein [bacterium]